MVEIFRRCLVKISTIDEKGFLTFYARLHYGNVSPILNSEKRDEMKHCIAYGGIFRDNTIQIKKTAAISTEHAI